MHKNSANYSYVDFQLCRWLSIWLLCCNLVITAHSQVLENGCDVARFGVDADAYAGGSQFGSNAKAQNSTDDWFKNPIIFSGQGVGIIDTTGASMFRDALQQGQNLSLTLQMGHPLNGVLNNVRLLDAVYGRDFYGGNRSTDLTSFVQASKNGESPAIWDTGPGNVTPKNDLIDCYGHLRRTGPYPTDALWLFSAFSRVSNTGSSYFDIELYADDIFYDVNANQFVTNGPDDGHTAWQFDAQGNITRIGDFVVSVNFSTGVPPELELRIWVSRNDWQFGNPQTFTFGTQFDGATGASTFGYADILPPTSGIYGCGLGNPDLTTGPPWGTLNSNGNFSFTYEQNQFVEIGVNLKAFGIDPALSVTQDGFYDCKIPFSSIMFKSRASQSFTSQLKDFSTPYSFGVINEVPVSVTADTITCAEPILELSPDTLTEDAYYYWVTLDGNILGRSDTSHVLVDQAGTYTLFGAPAQGCLEAFDTVLIVENFQYPNAYILGDTTYNCGPANPAHLIGGEPGNFFLWSGPNGFSATTAEVDVYEPGLYILRVTDTASLCSAYDSIYLPDGPCQPIDSTLLPGDGNRVVQYDTVPPLVDFPADITIYCGDDPLDLSLTGTLTNATDECSGDQLSAPFFIDIPYKGSCESNVVYIRLWQISDLCFNTAFASQRIEVADTSQPYFTTPPDVTLDCDTDLSDLSITGDVTDEGDDCDSNIGEAVYQDSLVNLNATCVGNDLVLRVWRLTDDCDNTFEATQRITLIDTIAPTFTVPPDITIACDQDPNDLNLTGDVTNEADGCDPGIGEATYTDQYIGNNPCAGSGIINRFWRITDACGNVNTQVQVIVLEDSSPPTFTVPSDLTLTCDVDIEDLTLTGDVTDEWDSCDPSIAEATYSDAITPSGLCPSEFTITRIWTLIDHCGFIQTGTQTITVVDTVAPSFTVPADITIDCTEDPDDLNLTGDVFNEQDNCDQSNLEATYTDVRLGATPCGGSSLITRTWTLTDACGNISTADQLITVEDNTAPFFFGIPTNPQVSCDSLGAIPVIGVDLFIGDNCDTSLTVTFNEERINASCPNVYTLKRTWIAEDDCGNIDSISQYIEVMDNDEPTIIGFPPDIMLSCSDTLPAFDPEISDNCSDTIAMTYQENIIPGSCPQAYTIVRTWTWGDSCNNINSRSQSIDIVDNTPPTFTTPDDITLDCSADISDLTLTGDVSDEADDCQSNGLDATYADSTISNISCNGSGLVLRTWILTDSCGNSATGIQQISLIDTTATLFTGPADTTLPCDADPTDLTLTGTPTISIDNCDPGPGTLTYRDSLVEDVGCQGTILIFRTWRLRDDCGNETRRIQLITLQDQTSPVFTTPPDITISCETDYSDLLITGDVTDESDNCQLTIGQATYSDSLVTSASCSGSGIIYRRWYLSDACGNDTSSTQTISLIDTTPPFFVIPDDLTLSCETDPTNLTITGIPTGNTDICDTNIGMASYTDSLVTGSCQNSRTIYRRWILSDDCGNSTIQTQQINLIDTVAPTFILPPDISIDCSSDPDDLGITGTISSVLDNCDSIVTNITYTDSLLNQNLCGGTSVYLRNWLVSDDCGNTRTGNQLITLQDTSAPQFTTPPDITISCELDPSDLSITGTVDLSVAVENCDTIPLILTYQDSMISNSPCDGAGIIYRKWTVRDDCGNQSSAWQRITLTDQTPPVFDTPEDVTIDCSQDPNWLSITGDAISEGDNCDPNIGQATYTDTLIYQGGCEGTGTIQRIWSLSDACANVYADTQLITIVDNLPPLFYPPADIEISCDQDPTNVKITGEATGEGDHCDTNIGEAIYTDSIAISDSCVNNRSIYRLWSLSDACGNTNTYLQIIRIRDTIKPTFTLPPDITISCEQDINDLSTTGDVIDEFDLCDTIPGEASYTDSLAASLPCPNLQLIHRRWTLTDACGNDTSAIQLITIIDTTGPVFNTPPADITLACDSLPDPFNLTATDPCGGNVNIQFLENQQMDSCSFERYVLRTWIATDRCNNISIYQQTITLSACQPDVQLGNNYQNVCVGDSTSFNISLSPAMENPFFQWEYSADNGSTWTPIIQATDSVLSLENIQVGQAGLYRCLVANNLQRLSLDSCRLISDTALLEVNALPAPVFINENICFGDSITFFGQTYYQTGIYSDTLSTSNGCDSIVNLVLTEDPEIVTNLNQTICFGDSFLVGTSVYTDSGTYADTLSAANGCDSIVNLVLIENPEIVTNLNQNICYGDSFIVGTSVYTDSGTYADTLTATNGCDSIVNLVLTEDPEVITNLNQTICFGDSVVIGISVYTDSGTYADTLTATNGCDSIVNLVLIENPEIVTNLNQTICYGDSFVVGTSVYTDSGTYADTLTATNGCDSIVNLVLTEDPEIVTNLNQTICFGDSFLVGTSVYTDSGTYADTLSAANGCDSIVNLVLTENPEIVTNLNQTICYGDSFIVGTSVYTNSGTYADTLSATNGCDSIVNLVLIEDPEIVTNLNQTICYGDSLIIGTSVYTDSGTYTDTLSASNGCDSIVNLVLTEDVEIIINLNQTICYGDSVVIGTSVYTDSGTYIDTLTAANGCNSIINLVLIEDPEIITNLNQTICFGDSVVIGTSVYSASGTYADTLTAANGCDSIVNLVLIEDPEIITNLNQAICYGDSIFLANKWRTTSGTYFDSLQTTKGCDSVVVTQLIVHPNQIISSDEQICEGDSLWIAGAFRKASGIYSDTFQTTFGCDSIIATNLIVTDTIRIFDRVHICPGMSYYVGGAYQTTAGIYTDLLNNPTGCDTLLITELVIGNEVITSVDQTICEGDSIFLAGDYRNAEGTYSDTLTLSTGCDSIVHYQLTVRPNNRVEEDVQICEGDSVSVGLNVYYQSGRYIDTLVNAWGCDSIHILDLTVLPRAYHDMSFTICANESFVLGKKELRNSGTYTDTLTSVNGCDSIVRLQLTVLPLASFRHTIEVCEGEKYWVASEWQSEAGLYVDTLSTVNGCDSLVFTDLVFHPNFTEKVRFDLCEGDVIQIGQQEISTAGYYSEELQSIHGCDSLVNYDVRFYPTSTTNQDIYICPGESYFAGGAEQTTAGIYIDSLRNNVGCDNIVFTNLYVYPTTEPTLLQSTICQGDSILIGGVYQKASGIYTDSLQTTLGCDSLVIWSVDVILPKDTSINISICEGDSIWLEGAFQKQNGIFTLTLSDTNGCDSIVTVNLEVAPNYTDTLSYLICENDSLLWDQEYYFRDTNIVRNYNSSYGCDSTIIFELRTEEQVELITEDASICWGESVQLFTSGAENVSWRPATGLSCTGCPNPIASPTQTTTYIVSTESCGGTLLEKEVTVVVHQIPQVQIHANLEILLGDTLVLTATSNDPNIILSWEMDGSTLCSVCPDTFWLQPTRNVEFTVSAVDSNDCASSDQVRVKVRDECVYADLFIPNFITPNDDGKNDEFRITDSGVKSVSLLRIYNRWGELVFETTDISRNHWDGTFRGKPVNPGVFVYYLEGECLNEMPLIIKGNVTVIR